MGLFGKKKEKEPEEKQTERKEYIRGAGGSIVTKSVLNGTAKLKWMFREETFWSGRFRGQGMGWFSFRAVWETVCTADTGEWTIEERPSAW